MRTIHSITDEQIEALRAEAAAAGDRAQVITCDHALGREVVFRGPSEPSEHDAIVRALGMTKDEARAECARVIADAQARAE